MLRSSISSTPRSRTAFVGLLLVGALALSGVLAWQVVDAGRSHEAVAHTAVKEQALFAAWEFGNNARRLIGEKLTKPGLDVVAVRGGKGPDRPLRYPESPEDWGYLVGGAESAGAFFRLELSTGELTLAGPEDPGLERWARTGLDVAEAMRLGYGWDPLLADPGDGLGWIAYRSFPEGESPERIFGFRLRPEALSIPLGYAFEDPALLPEALTDGRDNELLFSVAVRDADHAVLWRTPRAYSSSFVATDTMGARFAGLETVLTVNPAMAESLTIGGFPASRLPMAVGLLLLTGGLVAAAFYQLRREAELGRLRADFVSGVSHELRTPLAQIRMFAETLQLGRVRSEEERDRSLAIIVDESQRLTHQVENVLLYSRAERDALKVSREVLDLGCLVHEVAEAFEPLARKARCRLHVETAPGLEARVDGALVRQVLLNLLDNATKYGPPGQTVELGAGRAPGGRIVLWVEDQGSGIPREDRDRIWDPYYRLEEHRESAVAGSGIGLSVVRRVVEALDGTVRVEDGESGGARFVLELPATRGADGARRDGPPGRARVPRGASRPKEVSTSGDTPPPAADAAAPGTAARSVPGRPAEA